MKAALLDLAVTLALVLGACEAEDGAVDAGSAPLAGPPIVGDWFTCDDGCRELRSGGLRFTADLHVHHLVSPDGGERAYVEGEPYCVSESFATYVHEAGLLTLAFHDGSLVTTSDFDIDDGGATALHGTMRKVSPNGTGRWQRGLCLRP